MLLFETCQYCPRESTQLASGISSRKPFYSSVSTADHTKKANTMPCTYDLTPSCQQPEWGEPTALQVPCLWFTSVTPPSDSLIHPLCCFHHGSSWKEVQVPQFPSLLEDVLTLAVTRKSHSNVPRHAYGAINYLASA